MKAQDVFRAKAALQVLQQIKPLPPYQMARGLAFEVMENAEYADVAIAAMKAHAERVLAELGVER